jgi:hypothetical protein
MNYDINVWNIYILGLNRTEGYVRDQGTVMSSYASNRPRIGSRTSYPTQDYYNRDYDNYSMFYHDFSPQEFHRNALYYIQVIYKTLKRYTYYQ